MPIYEYRRPDGSTFEVQQAFSDEALTVDPETGVVVQRVLHAPAVHFKGKGFYNTDYGTRNRQRETAAAGDGAKGASGEGGSTEGAKGESKGETGSSGGKSEDKGSGKTESKSSGGGDGASQAKKPVASGKG
jgi:putative FmdB family regulatory protein